LFVLTAIWISNITCIALGLYCFFLAQLLSIEVPLLEDFNVIIREHCSFSLDFLLNILIRLTSNSTFLVNHHVQPEANHPVPTATAQIAKGTLSPLWA
jgi:hypothetical protein